MEEVLRPDLCVIGAGSGGLSVAASAAQLGVPVVLIEKGRMGGDSLNYGCVPSKALLAAGKRAEAIRTAEIFGIETNDWEVDSGKVHDYVHGVIGGIAPNDSMERFTGLGVRVIRAKASFFDRRTVEAGHYLIRARRFVVATGSSPVIPPVPGLDSVAYYTNETIFDITEKVEHLIVLGGAPIGLELAQAHRLLGAKVTVVDAAAFLGQEDPEASRVVIDRLAAHGIGMHSGTRVERVKASAGGISVSVGRQGETSVVTGSHLLVAAGRKPNLKGLNLERAGVRLIGDGIKVNEQLKTTNWRVYAIGDAIGGEQYTHLANYHASIVIKNALFRRRPKASASPIPRVTFTDPELAHVGLTEYEARKRYRRIRIFRWPFADNDRAQAEHTTHGFIKAVVRPNGEILGCTLVGPSAGELIQVWVMGLHRRMRIEELTGLVFPYPTLSEISKRVGYAYYQPTLRSRWLRWTVDFLRWLG